MRIYSNELQGMDGKKVTIAGWLRTIRDIGKTKFLIVADRFGSVQIVVKKGEVSDDVEKKVSPLNREDVLSVSGIAKASKQAPNGIEIFPEGIEILAKAETPLPIETDERIKSNLDTRLDYRFLDLRKPENRAVFRIKDVIQRNFVRYLEEHGFILVNTPVIVAAATEGGTDLFPISYFEKEAFLGQSPQLYKQILMASGLDKVAIIVPVFRAEEHDTSFHLNESIQMDIETAFVKDEEDALRYLDGVIGFIYKKVKEECKEELELLNKDLVVPELPIKRLTYDEAIAIAEKEKIKIKWGEDLTPEAQRAICKHHNPVIIKKWPTDVRAFYAMPEPGNRKICRGYDLLIDGVEVCSGAQRIHDYKELVDEMKRRKMNPKNFKFYLDAFRYGMPPHAGWSIGLERITMIMTGLKNIREVVLFPRDKKRLSP
ncbi:MAG: aspartate--tRNA(Asn) ligase [Candidatus Aenigmatarchaeota archaeon]